MFDKSLYETKHKEQYCQLNQAKLFNELMGYPAMMLIKY